LVNWVEQIKDSANESIPVILIGNKCDKETERVILYDEGSTFAKENGFLYTETTSRDFNKVKIAFEMLSKEVIEKIDDHYMQNGINSVFLDSPSVKHSTSTITLKNEKRNCCT